MTSDALFSKIGIDSIGFYAPKYYLDLNDLAEIRNVDPNKFREGMLLREMRFPGYGEDAVSMAFKAGYNALMRGNIDPQEIDAIFVGTETITYAVKSISTILAQLLNISPNSLTQDIYNACAAATLAVLNAIALIEKDVIKKALVIGADICSYELGSPAEATQGAGAIALVISKNPRIATFSKTFGKVSGNINDFFRREGEDVPQVFGKYSVNSYIRFQLAAFDDLRKNLGDFHSDYYVFHAPYTKLPLKAMQNIIINRMDYFVNNLLEKEDPSLIENAKLKIKELMRIASHVPELISAKLKEKGVPVDKISRVRRNLLKKYNYKIFPQLRVPMHIGNMYSASVWAQTIYVLENYALKEDVIYFGSYGSGATCISGLLKVVPGFESVAKKGPTLEDYLNKKEKTTITEYENIRKGIFKEDVYLAQAKEADDNDHKGFELHFCDEGCIIPNIEGLNYCPEGHTGFHTKFFPLHAVLITEPEKIANPEQLKFVNSNYVRILGDAHIGSELECDMRRVRPKDKNVCDPKGLINWTPTYVSMPNGNSQE